MTEKADCAKPLRPIPQVDKILRHERLESQHNLVRREILTELIRRRLANVRTSAAQGETVPELGELAELVAGDVARLLNGGVRKVINATGVILNTNLGRAPVPSAAVDKLIQILPGYCSLEIDLASGKRGERTAVVEELLSLLIGCEAAIVVNNNAAAVMLAVTALAHGKEVVVSRGELIEIGGSFRLPDVITAAGGVLREVGTTNRTRIADYKGALSAQTGILMRCHRSNFEISGFTEQPAPCELAALAKESGVPFVEDLGSGALIDLSRVGVKNEPTVASVLETGCDLVLFSGDKLLGAVQSGIIAGKRQSVERLRKHPIYRALRADKFIIAILESVLAQYLAPKVENLIPALKMAHEDAVSVRQRAQTLVDWLNSQISSWRCELISTSATFGGGTLPGESLPSSGISLAGNQTGSRKISANYLAQLLRLADVPVISMVHEDKVLLDLRTVPPEDEMLLRQSLVQVGHRLDKP